MEIDITLRPGSSITKVSLAAGETMTAEGGSMVAMSQGIAMQTTSHKKGSGSIFKAIKRTFSGESFFMNHYTAGTNGGDVFLATPLPGDMMAYELEKGKLVVQSGSYVASEESINIDFNWQGFKSMFSGESMFWLEVTGKGKVILNSFGVIYPVQVDGEYIVDTGHIVAFEDTLSFSITKAGKSWISSILGGEGFVCKFHGKGTVWCQSHNPNTFGKTLAPNLKVRN
jgi:uncharacterized protein (TIGR00266 family)